MKRNMFRAFFMAISAVLLLAACENKPLDEIETTGDPGSIVGSWHLQCLTVRTETSINGSTHTTSNVTDFTNENCKLVIGKKYTATAQFNLEVEVSSFTYDPETSVIHFRKGLSVSDNGKAMALVNDYIVTVDETSLVLTQKDFNVSLGSLFSGNQKATYEFRREKTE